MQLVSYSNGPSTVNVEEVLEEKTKKYIEELVKNVTDAHHRDIDIEKSYEAAIERVKHVLNITNKRSTLDKLFQGKERITFSIPSSYEEVDAGKCDAHFMVYSALKRRNYEIVDYIKGICQKIGTDRKVKIGKVLTQHNVSSDIINGFANSPIRAGMKSEMHITLSRNTYDVATMSTFKGWTSCMNLIRGSNKYFVPHDVEYGTIIAYFHKPGITDMDKASGRILFKQFSYKDGDKEYILYKAESTIYGGVPVNSSKVGDYLANIINDTLEKPEGDIIKYKLRPIYNDGIGTTMFYKSVEWDFTIPKHVKMINLRELRKLNQDKISEVVRNHPNDRILFINDIFYKFFKRNLTVDDIEYFVNEDNYVDISKLELFCGTGIDKIITKDVLMKIKTYKYFEDSLFNLILYYYSGDDLSISDNLFEVHNEEKITMLNLYKSKDFTKVRSLTNKEYQFYKDHGMPIEDTLLSMCLVKTYLDLGIKMNNLTVGFSSKMYRYIEEVFTTEEIEKFISLIDMEYVYFFNLDTYRFMARYLYLDNVCDLFSKNSSAEWAKDNIPMFKAVYDNDPVNQSGDDFILALAC